MNDQGLAQELKRGHQVTLVLGAGVSRSRGLPLWSDLLRDVWKSVYKKDPYAEDTKLLEQCKSACEASGIPTNFLERLDLRRHPLELQLAFEIIFDQLRWSSIEDLQKQLGLRPKLAREMRGLSADRRAEHLFSDLLRRTLYHGQPRGKPRWNGRRTDTLSLVAAALRYDSRRSDSARKIARVITFNVDDLLERVVNSGTTVWKPRVYPVRWSSDTNSPPSNGSIAIYHLHGFVPSNPQSYPFYSRDGGLLPVPLPLESLVFTDEQYWRAMGKPGDFASRIFAHALGGTCVFIGVSMTDINLLRGLALHSVEVKGDLQYMTSSWGDSFEAVYEQFTQLSGHYWITVGGASPLSSARSDFGSGVLRMVLSRNRGIQYIDIPSWESKEFHNWWSSCFLS